MTKARDLANSAAAFAAVSATELGYVDGVTSAIQTQMDAKAPSSTAVTLTGTQTLTNKTLTSPVIASVINNTLTSTTGDIIYASAANTPARLAIGSASQVLTVASGIPSWATPAAATSGYTQITSGSFTSVSSVAVDSVFSATYKRYQVFVRYIFVTSGGSLLFQYRYAGPTTESSGNYIGSGFRQNRSNTKTDYGYLNTTSGTLDTGGATNANSMLLMTLDQVGNSSQTPYNFQQGFSSDSQAVMQSSMFVPVNRTFTGFILTPSAGTLTGEYAVYGLAN